MASPQYSDIHGGDIRTASQLYNIPEPDWIDLSTGLNPIAYPCHDIPSSAYSRMPYPGPAFKRAVKSYYGHHPYVCIPGTQSIIEHLPKLLSRLPVILPTIGYQEHHIAWKENQNAITYYDSSTLSRAEETIENQLKKNPRQHLLIINPNNPSGLVIPCEKLLQWANQLAEDALLIVDEAFVDLTPGASLLSQEHLPNNMIILRSFGKFFGLAGIRAGFLFANNGLIDKLRIGKSPWPLSGPALYIVEDALMNRGWQHASRKRIEKNAQLMLELFSPLTHSKSSDSKLTLITDRGLFICYQGQARFLDWLYKAFANAGILLRLIALSAESSILRIGLIDHLDHDSAARIRRCIDQIVHQNTFDSFVKSRPRISIPERNQPNN